MCFIRKAHRNLFTRAAFEAFRGGSYLKPEDIDFDNLSFSHTPTRSMYISKRKLNDDGWEKGDLFPFGEILQAQNVNYFHWLRLSQPNTDDMNFQTNMAQLLPCQLIKKDIGAAAQYSLSSNLAATEKTSNIRKIHSVPERLQRR